jgi:lincosamide nucleotidyltransferase A/C/D/E
LMTETDVIDFYTNMEHSGISIWLDGGWGVDALLGEQTRCHNDLDIFVQEKDESKLRKILEQKGNREIKLEIARPYNYVMGDNQGHEIDMHVFVFEGEHVIYGLAENNEVFPAVALGGNGFIAGQMVKCISPEWMVKWHTGYKLRKSDFKDVTALCNKFGIKIPDEYLHFNREG